MKSPNFKRCRVCLVLTRPADLHGGRCEACRPKPPKPVEAKQEELGLVVPFGCAHATADRLVCEACASLVRPLRGGVDEVTGEVPKPKE